MAPSRFLLSVALIAALGFCAPVASAADRGEALYDVCSACHGQGGAGSNLFLAPAIAGMPLWYVQAQLTKFRVGHRGATFDDITGMRMRPMARTLKSEQDVELVAEYVANLPVPPAPAPVMVGGDAARGQALYAVCTACHGVDGAGNKDLFAPPLLNTQDWYLYEQLKKFKAGIRGLPTDPTGILMRPNAMALDDQGMRDVVAYIMTLNK